MNAPELMDTFDDERKQRNYAILINTISFLESDGRITEDWMEENKDRITLYRECFEDFTKVNPEIQDPRFRRLAEETEVIMTWLYMEVLRTRTFTVSVFLQLNKHLMALVSGVFEDSELSNMFQNMGLN
jgi:hypothetical protein